MFQNMTDSGNYNQLAGMKEEEKFSSDFSFQPQTNPATTSSSSFFQPSSTVELEDAVNEQILLRRDVRVESAQFRDLHGRTDKFPNSLTEKYGTPHQSPVNA
ncbi:hypothetical protein I3843_07G036500 [Carya illinoinensis]|nr:hypothetical protein I3843_07G036500 [Carya illinoinensis]